MRLLTRKELAEVLSVHVNTVDNNVKKGMPVLKVGHVVRFDLDEVINWLKEDK